MPRATWLPLLLLVARPLTAQEMTPPLGAQQAPPLAATGGPRAAAPARAPGPRRAPARLPELARAAVLASAPATSARAPREPTPVPLLVGAGILGGGVGLLGGAFAGAWGGNLSCKDQGGEECDTPIITGALIGGVAGEALLLPLAEHLGNYRRGPFLAELGASVGLAGAGLLLLEAFHYDKPAAPIILVAVPIAQLAAVTALEHRGRR